MGSATGGGGRHVPLNQSAGGYSIFCPLVICQNFPFVINPRPTGRTFLAPPVFLQILTCSWKLGGPNREASHSGEDHEADVV